MKVVCSLLLVYKYKPVISIRNMYFTCTWTCMTVTFVSWNAVSKPTTCKTVHTTLVYMAYYTNSSPDGFAFAVARFWTASERFQSPDGARWCPDGSRRRADCSRCLWTAFSRTDLEAYCLTYCTYHVQCTIQIQLNSHFPPISQNYSQTASSLNVLLTTHKPIRHYPPHLMHVATLP